VVLVKGNPVSPGIAIGKVFAYFAFSCDVFETYVEAGMEQESMQHYRDALHAASDELDAIIQSLQQENDDKYKIFEAHKEILEDEEIAEEISAAILDERAAPDYAVDKTFTAFAKLLSKAKDPLIAARSADLRDVRNRLLRILHGEKERNLSVLPENVVIVAHDLLPSDTATLNRDKVLGIVTEVGSSTSHSAIIARSYGIPAVLGVADATAVLQDGSECIVDALEGNIYIQPTEQTVAQFRQKQNAFLADTAELLQYYAKPAFLKSGERIEIGLNVGSCERIDAYDHVDFVGLLRSEFLYMQSDHMPTEEEQYRAYVNVIRHASGRPVTLRTLDVGGDKTLPYFSLPKEDNPFLGNRALRLCLANPDMFRTQLRAALRASAEGPLWLMFPMVGSIDDIRAAKEAVNRAKVELRQEGIPFDASIHVGIMIEIPSIALMADLAAAEVDFASVGSNDLTQYTHAADRMNAQISAYYQSFSPAMLRLLAQIFRAFDQAGKPVSVCGEMAGNPMAAVIMAGLGLRKMSMSASSISQVKRVLSRYTLAELQTLSLQAMRLPTQTEVKVLAQASIDAHLAE